MGPGGRDNAMRWLPELPPAMKVPSAAAEPGAVSQLPVRLIPCHAVDPKKAMLIGVTNRHSTC